MAGQNRFGGGVRLLALVVVAVGAGGGLALAQAPPEVDLTVEKTDNPDPATVGEELRYTITVSNVGTAQATDVTLTDELPDSVDFVSASAGCSFAAATRTVTCELGNLAAGASKVREITVSPREAGQLRNEAAVTATQRDAKQNDNRDLEKTKVDEAGPTGISCAGRRATIVDPARGDAGVVTGTPRPDVIVGLGGNDTIKGRRGDDLICGGRGNDVLVGNAGDDEVRGKRGSDRLRGRRDDDELRGGGGPDRLNGGRGTDECHGGGGNDRRSRCES